MNPKFICPTCSGKKAFYADECLTKARHEQKQQRLSKMGWPGNYYRPEMG